MYHEVQFRRAVTGTPYQTMHLLDEQLRLRILKLEMEVRNPESGMRALRLVKLGMLLQGTR